ncbi:MAG: hypothetical protein ACXWQ5_00915 [Ktedonobacterales bacterium]
MNDETPQTYVNQNGTWIPVPNDGTPEVSPEELEDEAVTQTEYLDEVIESMTEASLDGLDFTLDHDDAGMVSDYIEELRARVEALELSLRKVPNQKIPVLNIVADAAERFVHYFGDGDTFSDDALQAYDTLRYALTRYKA